MMAITITNLPVEVQDLILNRLDVQSLTSAMRCCALWHQVGQNVLKSWCITHISKEILSEIINSADEQIDWLQITLEWSQFPTFCSSSSKLNPSTIFPPTNTCTKKNDHLPIAISGDYLFVAHTSKVFAVINDSPTRETLETSIEVPRNCFDLKLLNSSKGRFVLSDRFPLKFALHDHIITVSSRSIYVQTLPNCGGRVVFKSRLQTPCLRAVSTCRGNQFAFYSHKRVSVYQMRLQDVTLVCQFQSRPLRVLQLWMDDVICIDNFGCVTKYSISTQAVVYTCNRMTNVLRYPLTTVIRRGVIFADLKMMKTMLSYWHVASGKPEWALCNVSDAVDDCCWERVNSNVNADEEITTFSMRKAVIVAGTSKGRVAFYRHLGCTDQITSTISQPPLFTVTVAPDEPITFCDFSTPNATLHLCVRTKCNSVLTLTIPTTEMYN